MLNLNSFLNLNFTKVKTNLALIEEKSFFKPQRFSKPLRFKKDCNVKQE